MKNITEQITSPDYLLVAEEPLSAITPIRRLSLPEIRGQFGFIYLEHIRMAAGMPILRQDEGLEFHWHEHVEPRLKASLNDILVICRIDDEVGYGVFTKKAIPAGTIIGIYAGEVELAVGENDYAMSTSIQGIRINATRIGGITRFIQHMPDDVGAIVENLVALDLCQQINLYIQFLQGNDLMPSDQEIMRLRSQPDYAENHRQQMITVLCEKWRANREMYVELGTKPFLRQAGKTICKTANLKSSCFVYQDIPILHLKAQQDIPQFGQLGINYGYSYWQLKNKVPKYFTETGKVLPQPAYLPSLESILAKYKSESEVTLPTPEQALRRSAAFGFQDDLLYLLEYGVNINAQAAESLKTALHFAREHKQKNTANFLLERGARHDIPDKKGRTVLQLN